MAKGKSPKPTLGSTCPNCYSRPPPSVQGDLSPKLYSGEDVKYVWKMCQSFFTLSSSFSKEGQQSDLAEAFGASCPSLWWNNLSSALLASTLSVWLRAAKALTGEREFCAVCTWVGGGGGPLLRNTEPPTQPNTKPHRLFLQKRHTYSHIHKHIYICNFFQIDR